MENPTGKERGVWLLIQAHGWADKNATMAAGL